MGAGSVGPAVAIAVAMAAAISTISTAISTTIAWAVMMMERWQAGAERQGCRDGKQCST